jgi:hypothetical protein
MQLFTSNVNGDAQHLLDVVQTRVTPEMNLQLMVDFTEEEIKKMHWIALVISKPRDRMTW